jgi:hypothetical protein
MSYDIDLVGEPCPHCGTIREPESHNPTYNLTPIFDLALTGEPLPSPNVSEFDVVIFRKDTERPRGLRLLSGQKASATLTLLEKGLAKLQDPAMQNRFKALEPPNRWGTLEDAVAVFEYLIADAKKYPDNTWRIR